MEEKKFAAKAVLDLSKGVTTL